MKVALKLRLPESEARRLEDLLKVMVLADGSEDLCETIRPAAVTEAASIVESAMQDDVVHWRLS